MTSKGLSSTVVTRVGAIAIAAIARACSQRPGLLDLFSGGAHQVIYRVSTCEPIAGLTIDDAPFATSTPSLLDVLGEVGSHATFFVIGSHVRGNEAVMERLVQEGHEIGHHMLRDVPSHKLQIDRFRQEFLETHAILCKFTDNLRWFRPGSGRFTPTMLEVIHDFGYTGVLGDVYPFDPHFPSVGFASDVVLRATRPGSIIILHDGLKRGHRTVKVLNRAVPVLNAVGYRFVTLSNLIAHSRTASERKHITPEPGL
jgi:peptidoglycan/xylan/chitin deacetylase (PgdA/CDA1 family)